MKSEYIILNPNNPQLITEDSLSKLISDKSISGIYEIYISPRKAFIEILAEGDWKHTHILLKSLMKSLGYRLKSEQVESECGDWYTAWHTYKIIKPKKKL